MRSASLRRRRLILETLETRAVPATLVWTGAAGDELWSSPNNWAGGGSPELEPAPDLVFPAAAAGTSQNDFAAGKVINSLTLAGAQSTLTGNPIKLGVASAAGSGSLITQGGNHTIELDIGFQGIAGSKH